MIHICIRRQNKNIMKIKTTITSVLSLVFVITFVSAQTYNCPMGGYGGMMSGTYGYGGAAFGWIFSILVIVALVLLIVWLIKQIQRPNRRR